MPAKVSVSFLSLAAWSFRCVLADSQVSSAEAASASRMQGECIFYVLDAYSFFPIDV
jgi:hypothetical protein